MCKIYYHPEFVTKINASVMSEQKLEVVSQHDIDHHIFTNYNNIKEKLFELFEYCYTRFYRPGYEFLKTFKEKYNNYSNFTKINNNYATYIFKQIVFEFRNGIPADDCAIFDSILYNATQDDIRRDAALLEKYVNVVFVDLDTDSHIPEETIATIKEALTEYRTKTYKFHRIKPYEVFKNLSCDRIAKFAPCTLEDLRDLRCLDEAQFTLYSEDIVDIISRILNS